MNINKHQVDNLNAVVEIELAPEDYSANVEKSIKDYAKRAQMPGFRPGKVPVGMVKKMYGRSILADEINKILSDKLFAYLRENNLDILGQPLPKEDQDINWDNPGTIRFSYDVGLAPAFDLNLNNDISFNYYQVQVDDETLNQEVTHLSQRYGELRHPEVSEEKDMLMGELVELDEAGNEKEGGIRKEASIHINRVKDEAVKSTLIGKKAGDEVEVDPHQIWDDKSVMARMLGIEVDQADNVSSRFRFRIQDISRLEAAALTQELFDKIYGPGVITNEEEFRNRIREDIKKYYSNESDKKLYNDIVEYLIKNVKVDLPDAFLKRWLQVAGEKPLSREEVENNYEKYSEGIKWQLIENRIIRDNNITVTLDDIRDQAKKVLRDRFAAYGAPEPPEDVLEDTANRLMKNEKEAEQLQEQLMGQKVMDVFKNSFKLVDTELPLKEFVEKLYHKH